MAIVFFVSGHGFGHASRQVEVINALLAREPDARVIIRSAVNPQLLARTVRGPYDLRPGACDTGVIQTNSVTHDDAATIREAIAFHQTLDERARHEAAALAHDDVRLIVGDIPPLAFEVARRLSVPSVAIANFTWDWIYEAMPGLVDAAPWLPARLKESYASATRALELPMSGGFDVFPRREPLPFIARRATRTREDARRFFGLSSDGPVALLSFGGYGLPSLDLARLDCLDDWTIVTTDRTSGDSEAKLPRGIVRIDEASFIDSGFRYEDLVAGSDVVVTKPGYGIIAECAAAGTNVLYTSRGAFREYDVLVREMPRFVRSQFIPQAEFFAGQWSRALADLLRQPAPARPRVDGAERAVDALFALRA